MSWKIILQTILISIIFFLTLLLVVYLFAKVPGENEFRLNAIHLFIALTPFAVLMIVSGKLKEIRGPGGIALSMRDEIQKPIKMEYKDEQMEVNPEVVQAKGELESLQEDISENPTTTLSFQILRNGYYGQWAIEEYIRRLKRHPYLRNILFIDLNGRFQGYMNVNEYEKIIKNTDDLVQKLESGDILNYERINKNFIHINTTNKQALDVMESKNVNELAVVDESNRFVGVITQEEIVRKVLTAIIRQA